MLEIRESPSSPDEARRQFASNNTAMIKGTESLQSDANPYPIGSTEYRFFEEGRLWKERSDQNEAKYQGLAFNDGTTKKMREECFIPKEANLFR